MRRFILRLVNVFRRDRSESELTREMKAHLALLEDEHRRRGLTAQEARLAARRAMGSLALARDLRRDAESFRWVDDAWQDLRFAARMLVRSPGFAAVAILTMALTIAAITTLFSLTYGVLMRPLSWPEPDRLVRLQETRGGRTPRIPWTISNGTYLAWRENPATIEELGGWFRSRLMTVNSTGEPERLLIGSVTTSLFRVLRARVHAGRLFVEDDARPGQPDVVILGFGLWQRRFGGRIDLVGQQVRLDGRPHTVIGIMPRDFEFPNPEAQAWTPQAIVPVNPKPDVVSLMIFSAVARLRAGITVPQAVTEATARARAAPDPGPAGVALFGGSGPAEITALPARDMLTLEVRPSLVMLLVAGGLLSLASTASLIVLHLSRMAGRSRETAVRTAIGAGALRLVRQWLVESALLGVLGGLTGLLIAALLHRVLPAVLPAGFPRIDDVRLDWDVAMFAAAATMLISLACGMVPAFGDRIARLSESLTAGASGATPTFVRTRAARLRSGFMVAQVAVACVLLVGGALLSRSFARLIDADRGFDPRGLLTLRLPLPPKSTFPHRLETIDRLQSRLRALPGVTAVAVGNALPFVSSGGYQGMKLALPRDPTVRVDVETMVRAVTPDYLHALRLRVIAGRFLDDTDTASSQPVIVVNRTFARRYLGDRPIGQHLDLRLGDKRSWEVVGVVDDMRQGTNFEEPVTAFGGLTDPRVPEIFFGHRQFPSSYSIPELIVVIRTSSDPAALAADVRAHITAEDSSLPIDSVLTMEDRVAASLAGPRSYAVFVTALAVCALAIAGVGLLGVLSYTTSQRTREFGLRTALGARRADVLALVGRQALAIMGGGLAIGLTAALVLGRSLSAMLYGVSAHDAVSFLGVALLLVVVAVAACAAPAWRATRVDPTVALRSE